MGWNNIRVDAADKAFSLYIRLRDRECVICHKKGIPNAEGQPVVGLQCSHYWSRRHEATRYEPDNCDALCAGCHFKLGGDYREQYKEFKLKQLGQKRYDSLMLQAQQYQKKDRKLSLLIARELLKSLEQ